TRQGRLSASSAMIAAVSSMRLLVVAGSPPESSFSVVPSRSRAAQPPGPGLPRQAPSVKISTASSLMNSAFDPVGRGAQHLAVEFQFLPVFQRVLRLDQRAGHLVEPVVEPCEQE